jgi:hypothetical protein
LLNLLHHRHRCLLFLVYLNHQVLDYNNFHHHLLHRQLLKENHLLEEKIHHRHQQNIFR